MPLWRKPRKPMLACTRKHPDPDMQESIALTWSTLNARLKNLRAGAATAGCLLAALLALAMFLRSGWLWAGAPLLALVGYGFFLRDQNLLFAWEDKVLALWGNSDLSMGILVQTLAGHPGPLQATLKSMIAHLPPNPGYINPPAEAIRAERRLFWTRCALQEIRLHRAGLLNVAGAGLPLALWFGYREGWAWLPVSLAPVALAMVARAWAARAGLRRWERRNAALPDDKPHEAGFTERMEGLDWSGIPESVKTRMTGAPVPTTRSTPSTS